MIGNKYGRFKEKRAYLITKLIDGAAAAREFFGSAVRNEEQDLGVLKERLKEKYGLTKSQKKELDRIASGTITAREIVGILRERYGVNKYGEIREKRKLYRLICDEEPPKEDFSAVPYGFAIGLYLPERYFLRDGEISLGEASKRRWGDNLEEELERLKKGYSNGGLSSICFRINYKNLNLFKKRVAERHELKHLINNFLFELSNPLEELSSYIFDYVSERECINLRRYRHGLERDTANYKKVLKKRSEMHLKLEKLNAPEFIIENALEHVGESRKTMERLKGFPLELISGLMKKGVSNELISYIISMNGFQKVEKRLRMIDKIIA